jgi:hypothetical protein
MKNRTKALKIRRAELIALLIRRDVDRSILNDGSIRYSPSSVHTIPALTMDAASGPPIIPVPIAQALLDSLLGTTLVQSLLTGASAQFLIRILQFST